MNPSRFERAKEILLRIVDLPEAERKTILDGACADDPELRIEVEGLLAHDLPGTGGMRWASAASDDGTTEGTGARSDRFTAGQILGSRYRIVRLLGRGGMGEVWEAYDLKLQVDVALKAILPERFQGDQGLELLRREVRTAREVISPNVCRVFDLVDEEGQEFVSMEYIDGETLLSVLLSRGPLELQESTRIASQFLSGLDAIHQAGFVHRDVKPENIMITRTGRVVLMDFGIAKGIADDRRGTVAGTPAYMAPEQSSGESLDARADIFAAGVVLAEMSAPEGIREPTSRKSIWHAVRQTPVRLSDGPWRGVLERAVASEPSGRYESARELARALEEVTLRVEGAEDKHPYPGLNSFTAADAEFFFGREVEVEAVWKRLQRSNLLAIIGPSGAGKTSFLHAGLIPAQPAGWRHVVCRPGSSPFVALARALVSELAGDADASRKKVRTERPEQVMAAVERWRRRCGHALIIVDQFEELFTLCRPDVQAAFADLLGRLAAEADLHVLLVMRDDFLIRCHEHPRLASISSDLTMLGPPVGSALRRALVQPALLCGYRFEDESLADEMLKAVEGERGALPMLAFATARLWENRDRDRGFLTREAYERIGGVSGALAQHAEATLERIGQERQPVVREILRNLVTALGTRAAAEVEELLSVFPDREAASRVLQELVDARLLTSFELPDRSEGGRQRRRVEIVHESLLGSWPRLVRWRTQDAEGAQLRDQLRQAAQLWRERHESEDLLWTGTAFKEFELWRERYPGGVTATEDAFGRAMIAKAQRQRRRHQRIVVGTIAALVVVAAAMTAFGIRAQIAQRRGEAGRLLALGRNELEQDPTGALAYAIKSVELADSPVGRRFALEVLSRGPIAQSISCAPDGVSSLGFSPDGKRLAVITDSDHLRVRIYFRDGSPPVVYDGDFVEPQFAPDGEHIVLPSYADDGLVRVWSLSKGRETRVFAMKTVTLPFVKGGRLLLVTDADGTVERAERAPDQLKIKKWGQATVRAWAFDDREPETIGHWNLEGVSNFDIDPTGRWVAYTRGRGVYIGPIEELGMGRDRLVGDHVTQAGAVVFDATGRQLASADSSGEVRIWSAHEGSPAPLRIYLTESPVWRLSFDVSGTRLAAACGRDKNMRLWDLNAPFDPEPVVLRREAAGRRTAFAFDPAGEYLASVDLNEVDFWPLTPPERYSFSYRPTGYINCVFTPDGNSLIVAPASYVDPIQVWSRAGGPARDLWTPGPAGIEELCMDPLGKFVVVATVTKGIVQVSLADGHVRQLPDTAAVALRTIGLALSRDGRLVAGAMRERGIRVWDLETGDQRVLEKSIGQTYSEVVFRDDARLVSTDYAGNVLQWNLRDGTSSLVGMTRLPIPGVPTLTPDSRLLFVTASSVANSFSKEAESELICYDLEKRTSRTITARGTRITGIAPDPTERLLVTGNVDGVLRVGPIADEEPHMLIGSGLVFSIAVDPSGRWIAVGGRGTISLWRMPEGRPLHTLPRRKFLDHLRARTNLRAVPDEKSDTGYRLEWASFRGWDKAPAR